MKKRVLSVLLIIALLVTVGIIAAQAEGTTPTPSEVIAAAAELDFSNPEELPTTCPHCDKTVTWEPLPEITEAKAYGDKHFYVPEGGVSNGGNYFFHSVPVCLHLNGQTITSTGEAIRTGTDLAIMGNGAIVPGGAHASVYVAGDVTASIYGGEYAVINGNNGSVKLAGESTVYNLNLANGLTLGETALADGYAVKDVNGTQMCLPGFDSEDVEGKIAYANSMTFPTNSTNVKKFCPHCNTVPEWKPLSSVAPGTALVGGHYYVDQEHLTRTVQLAAFNGSTCIHLNDNKLESTGEAVFCGWANNSMTFMGNGEVVGTGVMVMNATSATTINIYGGTYTTTANVLMNANNANAVLNFYGGEFGSSNQYAVQLLAGADFNMYGGAITGKPVLSDHANSVVTVENGTVSAIQGKLGAVNISGGEITTTTITGASMALSGDPEIATLDMTAATSVATVSDLTEGAKIGVKADGAFTGEGCADYAKYFTALTSGHSILVDETTGVLSSGVYTPICDTPEEIMEYANGMSFPDDSSTSNQWCPKCNAKVDWKPLSSLSNALGNGHYYVDKEHLTRTVQLASFGGAVCLHLNGNKLESTGEAVFCGWGEAAKTMAIMGEGQVVGTGVPVGNLNATTFDIYGGTYSTTANHVIQYNGAADFNFHAGEIVSGNDIAVNLKKGTFNMKGGSITAGKISVAGGTLNVEAGEIVAVDGDSGTINLSGAPEITTLDLTSGMKLNTVALTEGASVAVKADGAFTTGDAASSAKYFTALTDGHSILVDETTGVLSSAVYVPTCDTPEEIMEYANGMSFPTSGNSTQFCPACNETVTWTALNSSNAGNALVQSGHNHYFIAENNLTRTGYIFALSGDVCVHLNGKTITHRNGNTNADATFIASKNMNIMGNGTVTSDVAVLAPNAGGVMNVYGGNFTTGANIIALNNSTFNMYAGSITGGQFWLRGTATASLENAEISYFKVEDTCTGKLNVAGETVIGTLELPSGKTLGTIALTGDAQIGVKADGVFTGEGCADYAKYFTALTSGHSILVDEATGVLSSGVYTPICDTPEEIMEYANGMSFPTSGNSTQFCPACNETVTWTALNSSNAGNALVQSGHNHYFIAENNLNRTGYIFAMSGDVCVHMNEKTWSHNGSDPAFISSKTINIMGGGTVTSNIAAFNPNGGTLNIYGGTYNSGANVHMRANSSTNVINVYDATFTGGIKVDAGTLNLSGAVSIDSLNVASGATLGTLALTEGAEIGITAEGAFTGAGNEAYKDYFKPATGYTVSADAEGVLSCAVKTYTIDEVAAYAETMKFTGTGDQKALCPKCNKSVTWTEVTAESNHLIGAANGGHYYLSDNITRGKTLLAFGGDVCFFFNGFTLTYDASVSGHESNAAFGAFVNGESVNDITLMGKGGVTTEKNQVALTNGATINVCGGTYTTANENEAVMGVNNANGVLNAYAGTFNCAGLGAGNGVANIEGAITGDVMGNNVNINAEFNGVAGPWDDNAVINTTVDVTVDVRGKKNVTVNGTGNVTAMDSYSQSAFQTDGYATFDDTLIVTAAKDFVLINDDLGARLYYCSMKVSGVSLKPGANDDKVGLYYKGKWFMDAALRDQVDVGVVISLVEAPRVDFYEKYEQALANGGGHKFFFSTYAGNTVGNGTPKTSVLVDGIMKKTNDTEVNKANAEKKIYAAAFIQLPDNSVIVSSSRHLSVHDVLNLIDGDQNAYDAQKSKLEKFCEKWNECVADWEFERIGK